MTRQTAADPHVNGDSDLDPAVPSNALVRSTECTEAVDPRAGLMLGSVLAAIGSIGYVSTTIVYPDADPREAYSTILGVVACIAATAGLMVLCLSLLRWRSALRAWTVYTVAAGLFFAGANAWFFASGIVGVAAHTTDVQFDSIGGSPWTLMMAAPKMILGLVGFLSLAISGWRSQSLPRSSCAVFALAALASLIAPFPPGALLASAAFFIAAATHPKLPTHAGAWP